MFLSYRYGRKSTVIFPVILGGVSFIVIALIPLDKDAGKALATIIY